MTVAERLDHAIARLPRRGRVTDSPLTRPCQLDDAALEEVQNALEEVRRTRGMELRMRVDLNAGEVLVRAIGNDLHMDYSAVGETTVLAARMEQMATPGSIRLTASTLGLVEGLVRVHALGSVSVKGLVEPVEVFELVGASPLRRRLQAAAVRGLTRFVGRQHELEALHQALAQAVAGHGQVMAVIGEPGVGKTRLFHEFTDAFHTQGWLLLETNSTSYGKATPYLPVIDLLKAYVQIEERDDRRRIREKLTGRLLTLDPALDPTLPALLSLLEVPVEDPHWQALDPSQRRQRTLDALKRLFLRESQVQPLVLVFENLHWIDSETRAFLDSLIESLPTARLLVLVNYRPEYQHGWGNKTYYTQLRLDPLPLERAEELLRALLGDDASLQLLTRLLIDRTAGNPFFLEESVRALVETRVLAGECGAYRQVQPLQTIQVPATVQAVLAARIDRLPPDEKRLLQTAAVIGTDVPLPLLQAVAEVPEAELRRSLTHLQAAEFLYETRLFPELEYTFKHALTYQVAYESLLQERRRDLHTRIMEALEAPTGQRLSEQVERLAHHALRGEVWEKAVIYLRQAGAKAFARSSNREALASFEQALMALTHLPETRETREQAIDVRFDLRNALFPLAEFGRIEGYLREAEALARTFDDQRRLGWVSTYMASHRLQSGGHATDVRTFAQRVEAIGERLGDVPLQVVAQYYLVLACYISGDYRGTEHLCRKLMQSLQGERTRERFGVGVFPAVMSRAYLARALAERGVFDEGDAVAQEAIRIAEALDHPVSIVWACLGLAFLNSLRGDLGQAARLLERAVAQCREWNIMVWTPIAMASLGHVYAGSGRLEEGISWLQQGLTAFESAGIGYFQSLSVVQLGEADLLAEQVEDARACADRAVMLTHQRGERGHEAWALRLLGEVASHQNRPDVTTAEENYGAALALASELGVRPLVAHCHRGLGTLNVQIDHREQASAELSIAIELYKAMAMTFWLPQAEAALAQVEGR